MKLIYLSIAVALVCSSAAAQPRVCQDLKERACDEWRNEKYGLLATCIRRDASGDCDVTKYTDGGWQQHQDNYNALPKCPADKDGSKMTKIKAAMLGLECNSE